MGKDNLLIGTARGKLGDVVFYRTGGEQRFRTRVRPMNPRTDAQLVQRCVVATAVKAYSNFITVCDHAFQNYIGKQKNMQRYMKLNIDKFRAIALPQITRWSPIEWSNTRVGNWSRKDDVNTYVNPYIVAEGDLPEVRTEFVADPQGGREETMFPSISIPLTTKYENISAVPYEAIVNGLGLKAGDQLTFISQTADLNSGAVEKTSIGRIILMPTGGNMEIPFVASTSNQFITIAAANSENYGDISLLGWIEDAPEGENVKQYFHLGFTVGGYAVGDRDNVAGAVIVSRYENNMWRRSNAQFNLRPDVQNLSDLEAAVASYLKSDTSSLYLNQATSGEQQALETLQVKALEEEEDMFGEPITEAEEKTPKRKK